MMASTTPAEATSKGRAAAKELLERAVPCDGTLNAYVRQKESSYQFYRMKAGSQVMLAKGNAERGALPQDPAEAARLVLFVFITGLVDVARVSELDYEPEFQRGAALVAAPHDPAAAAQAEQCVQLVRQMAPADPAAHNAAKLFGLYPIPQPAAK